jgi:hypothetical protein
MKGKTVVIPAVPRGLARLPRTGLRKWAPGSS